MTIKIYLCLLFIVSLSSFSFTQQTPKIYYSETLQIEQIAPNTFVHISYLNTNDFGKVACNGMIVISDSEAFVFDTPANDPASLELINWLENDQKAKVKGVVAMPLQKP
jgi:metallo-beta-lactamase class B